MDLKALAASLNLSMTTVSRALNGYSDVSEKTRQRVAEAAKELGYQPNPIARSLALGRANAIGIVHPLEDGDVADPRFLDVVAGLTEGLAPKQMDLLIASATHKGELETYERLVHGKRVDGFIVARTKRQDERIEYLLDQGVPFLAYGRSDDCARYPWFDFDNEAGARLAVERLVSLGHKRIGYLYAAQHYNFAYQRRMGFLHGLEQAGITPNEHWLRPAGLSRNSGYATMLAMLDEADRPTALIVDNNLAGEGAVRALLDRGVALGRELSIIIYDGSPPDTLLAGVNITSVIQPTQQNAGQHMARLIRMVMEGNHPLEDLQMLSQPALQIGESDGPCIA